MNTLMQPFLKDAYLPTRPITNKHPYIHSNANFKPILCVLVVLPLGIQFLFQQRFNSFRDLIKVTPLIYCEGNQERKLKIKAHHLVGIEPLTSQVSALAALCYHCYPCICHTYYMDISKQTHVHTYMDACIHFLLLIRSIALVIIQNLAICESNLKRKRFFASITMFRKLANRLRH